MSWAAIESTIRAEVAPLESTLGSPLLWLAAGQDRPAALHTTWAMLLSSTVPLGIGANLDGEPFHDRTEGSVQFDIYQVTGQSPVDALSIADVIRVRFRGLRLPGVRFLTPNLIPQGQDGAWNRWTVDCPFIAEEL